MYNDVHVGYKLEVFVISSTKTPVTFIAHLGNIPQDHDPMFTVASMFKQMQDLCVSFPVQWRRNQGAPGAGAPIKIIISSIYHV